jgi:hypothetical protein
VTGTGGDAGANWNRKCSAKLNLWETEQNLDQEEIQGVFAVLSN